MRGGDGDSTSSHHKNGGGCAGVLMGGCVGFAIWRWSGGRRKRWHDDVDVGGGAAVGAPNRKSALSAGSCVHRRGSYPCWPARCRNGSLPRRPPPRDQITHVHRPNPWREEARSWSESSRHPGKASDTQPMGRRAYGGWRRRVPARCAGMAWRYHPIEAEINQPDGPRSTARPGWKI